MAIFGLNYQEKMQGPSDEEIRKMTDTSQALTQRLMGNKYLSVGAARTLADLGEQQTRAGQFPFQFGLEAQQQAGNYNLGLAGLQQADISSQRNAEVQRRGQDISAFTSMRGQDLDARLGGEKLGQQEKEFSSMAPLRLAQAKYYDRLSDRSSGGQSFSPYESAALKLGTETDVSGGFAFTSDQIKDRINELRGGGYGL